MKILFLIHSLSSTGYGGGAGGAERAIVLLADYWASKEDIDVSFVTIGNQREDFYPLHPKIKRISLNLPTESDGNALLGLINNVKRAKRLRKVLKRIYPNVAISFMWSSNILLAYASKGLNIITIGSERSYPPLSSPGCAWSILRKISYANLDAIVALSRKSKDWLKQNTWASRIEMIPNQVPWPLESHTPIVPVHSVCRKRRKILLAVGRLAPEKAFDILITTFAKLAQKFSEWDLVIVGDGPEREKLTSLVSFLNLQNRVFMPGKVGNMPDWYNAGDLYVMTSRYEGFPNTLAEAMAHSLPAVSFDCDTGPRDIIRHNVDGLLVENGNLEELEKALTILMQDENMRKTFAERAIEVRTRFAPDKIMGMWEKLIFELLNARKNN